VKLILSRKGFDSSNGGVPSPVFPDGRMLSLPIPEQWASPITYEVRYEDLCWPGQPAIGDIVEQLTGGRVSRHKGGHIDPDIFTGSLPRDEGWRPIFGQTDAAQGHLKNKDIGHGDIFLFFGLFRKVETKDSVLRFATSCPQQHVIFGWLQVDRVVQVDSCRENMPWAHYHPHMHLGPDPRNTLYIASEKLTLPGYGDVGRPGAGVFDRYSDTLCLTAPNEATSTWLLPAWFAPDEQKPPLTYHSAAWRWEPNTEEGVLLRSVGRGQEFVLDCDAYPEAHGWLAWLFHIAPLTRPSGDRELSTS